MRRLATSVRLRALATLVACTAGSCLALLAAPPQARANEPFPVLAYYYIWYDPGSWARAKIDYPLLGRYSSDERTVMRQHIRWAKQAGIDGFIVSWKSTTKLNERLARLVHIADREHFKLAIIYEGLNFARRPLPVATVQADLEQLARRYAHNPAFALFGGKPVVIWSGTWEFSRAEIAQVAGAVRSQVLLLASERSPESYARVSGLVDGDAYYWSSANPYTYHGYQQRLDEFGRVVHASGGLWIPPAAPGFDARLVGGTSLVPRRGGDTFRTELAAAIDSSPDALGVISWNEFSENSYVEPSVRYRGQALSVLAQVLGAHAPDLTNFDSDSATAGVTGTANGVPLLLGVGIVALVGMLAIAWRRSSGPDGGDRPGDRPPARGRSPSA